MLPDHDVQRRPELRLGDRVKTSRGLHATVVYVDDSRCQVAFDQFPPVRGFKQGPSIGFNYGKHYWWPAGDFTKLA
jgi:hypothetical protein